MARLRGFEPPTFASGVQASNPDDATELPSFPVQQNATLAERDRLQPGECLATIGAAAEDQKKDPDKPPAAVSQDGAGGW